MAVQECFMGTRGFTCYCWHFYTGTMNLSSICRFGAAIDLICNSRDHPSESAALWGPADTLNAHSAISALLLQYGHYTLLSYSSEYSWQHQPRLA